MESSTCNFAGEGARRHHHDQNDTQLKTGDLIELSTDQKNGTDHSLDDLIRSILLIRALSASLKTRRSKEAPLETICTLRWDVRSDALGKQVCRDTAPRKPAIH
jgi:hypothetical protein